MKPKLIALNLLLIAGIGAVVWQARARWSESQEARTHTLNAKVKPAGLPPIAPEPKPDAPPATKYVDVATKNLFSKDRNPTVVIEPLQEDKPRQMPHLPIVYGVMGLPSGTKALMAERADVPGKSVRAGDPIGEFKIVSLDLETVVFNWQGKEISRKIEDLMDRSGPGGSAAAAPPPPPGAPAPAIAQQGQPQNPPPPQPAVPAANGTPNGSGPPLICRPNDPPPGGSVLNGYRKVVSNTPLGPICRWVAAQ